VDGGLQRAVSDRLQCLLQTREGYPWIGTEAGPARFDGNQFRAFDQDTTPALSQARLDSFSFTETGAGSGPAPTVVARPGGSPLAGLVLAHTEKMGGAELRGWFDPDQPSRRVLDFLVGKEAHRFHWIGPAHRSDANASRFVP
jgi:hypothetical protein